MPFPWNPFELFRGVVGYFNSRTTLVTVTLENNGPYGRMRVYRGDCVYTHGFPRITDRNSPRMKYC